MIDKIKKLLKEFGVYTYNVRGEFIWDNGEMKATEWVFHCNKTFGSSTLDIVNKNIEDINHLFYEEGNTAVHFIRTPEDLYVSFKVKDLVLEQWYDELFELYILYDRTYPAKINKERVKELLLETKNKKGE